jgi:dephospho-CoA kinase
MKPPLIVGLTGGIGSGKTEVTRAFAALGVECADADEVAHAVTATGTPGLDRVVGAFGETLRKPDGALDRAALRRVVFSDPDARKRLEGILHPLIRAELDGRIGQWRGPYGILSVPLLLESGALLPRVARVLVVDCPEDEQERRVMQRSGLTATEVRAIMATQLSRTARLARADDVIDNSGPREALRAQVLRLHGTYQALAALEPASGSPENGAQTRAGTDPT